MVSPQHGFDAAGHGVSTRSRTPRCPWGRLSDSAADSDRVCPIDHRSGPLSHRTCMRLAGRSPQWKIMRIGKYEKEKI